MNIFQRKIATGGSLVKGFQSKYLSGHRMLPVCGNFSFSSLLNSSPGLKKPQPQSSPPNTHQCRNFSSNNQRGGVRSSMSTPQGKYVKPIDIGTFQPLQEPVIQLENGYYLLYYHRQKTYTMLLLYLRYIIPIFRLIYLIKKNPFYKTYPIMLPVMFIALFTMIYK